MLFLNLFKWQSNERLDVSTLHVVIILFFYGFPQKSFEEMPHVSNH